MVTLGSPIPGQIQFWEEGRKGGREGGREEGREGGKVGGRVVNVKKNIVPIHWL